MRITVDEQYAVEISDSRARPTLVVTLDRERGASRRVGVPAGASTGSREAVERRDGDPARDAGQGVRGAVASVNGALLDALAGRSFDSLADVDAHLIALDGTEDRSRLGANAIVGCRWSSLARSRPWPGSRCGEASPSCWAAPACPSRTSTSSTAGCTPAMGWASRCSCSPRSALRAWRRRCGQGPRPTPRYETCSEAGDRRRDRGDAGGFAPELTRPEDVLEQLAAAITLAGYLPGRHGVAIAMDPASSELEREGSSHVAGESLSTEDMIGRYEEIVERFPVWQLEGGLAEPGWDGWKRLTARIGDRVELVGDDISCTSPSIMSDTIARKVANASLITVNQTGTVTETLRAMRVCQEAGYAQFVSHRSGETADAFIADLAVGTDCGHMKRGAPDRDERIAAYNRLIEIEDAETLPYGLREPRA